MPPQLLFDIAALDLDRILFGKDAIREYNPQRGEMEQLDAIVYADPDSGRLMGYKDVRPDEFWIPGHIPGRPLLPGVLMIEAAAQLASFYTKKYIGWKGFIGFAGVEECKFRQQVVPGQRLYLMGQRIYERHGRVRCKVQGLVEGQVVFEVAILGQEF